MKYKQVINGPDSNEWVQEIENKHARMVSNGVCVVLDKKELSEGAKVISSVWAYKKKRKGTYYGRLNTGY